MNNTIKFTSLAAAALLPLASHAAEYATVISATPVTASVNVPRRVCSDDRQYVQPQPSGAGAVIGAIAGGLLGNAVGGHGGARAAATGVGAVAGAAVGNSVEMNGYPPTEVPVRRCQTVSGYENRTVGYDVVYEYAGRRYTTRTDRDPGSEIAIDVRPSGAAQPDAQGPGLRRIGAAGLRAGACPGLLPRRTGLLRPAAGLLHRAGDRPGHRPRVLGRPPRPSALALRSVRCREKRPAGPLFHERAPTGTRLTSRRRGPSRAPCSNSPTRCRTRRRP